MKVLECSVDQCLKHTIERLKLADGVRAVVLVSSPLTCIHRHGPHLRFETRHKLNHSCQLDREKTLTLMAIADAVHL
jgi:hypothetical protein